MATTEVGQATFQDNTLQKATLYVPIGCANLYKSVAPWRDFSNIKEKDLSGVESIVADDDVDVSVENGRFVVKGADNAKKRGLQCEWAMCLQWKSYSYS